MISPINNLTSLQDTAGVFINGDINGNGTPDIYIDGGNVRTYGIYTQQSSHNKIKGLIVSRFITANIYIQLGRSNTVQTCYVSTDPSATARASTTQGNGIYVFSSDSFLLGGSIAARDGNIISGCGSYNSGVGYCVYLYRTNHARILGNIIGLGYTGQEQIGNDKYGIFMSGSLDTDIGYGTYDLRNTISYNAFSGIQLGFGSIAGSKCTYDTIWFNFVGTDTTGELPRGNRGGPGIMLYPAWYEYIAENVISDNRDFGIRVSGGAAPDDSCNFNLITNNIIGTDYHMTGIQMGNWAEGVHLGYYGRANTVEFNTIVYSMLDGVGVGIPAGTQVCMNMRISQNDIYDNGELGIDLNRDGVSVNDPGDLDGGSNTTLNYPEIDSQRFTPPSTIEFWGYCTAPLGEIEAYLATGHVDPTGYGEGYRYLATTLADGTGHFHITLNGIAPGDDFTFLTIDTTNNTSEFSPVEEAPLHYGLDETGAYGKADMACTATGLLLTLARASWVDLRLYRVDGALASVLVQGNLGPGRHEFPLTDMASGTYIARAVIGGKTLTTKVVRF